MLDTWQSRCRRVLVGTIASRVHSSMARPITGLPADGLPSRWLYSPGYLYCQPLGLSWFNKRGYANSIPVDPHLNRPVVEGVQHPTADRLIRGVDLGQIPTSIAAEDHAGRRTPFRQTRRVALAAAVVRGQQHVAMPRLLGQHVVQAGRFQVAGQQNLAALDSPPPTQCCWRCPIRARRTAAGAAPRPHTLRRPGGGRRPALHAPERHARRSRCAGP